MPPEHRDILVPQVGKTKSFFVHEETLYIGTTIGIDIVNILQMGLIL